MNQSSQSEENKSLIVLKLLQQGKSVNIWQARNAHLAYNIIFFLQVFEELMLHDNEWRENNLWFFIFLFLIIETHKT